MILCKVCMEDVKNSPCGVSICCCSCGDESCPDRCGDCDSECPEKVFRSEELQMIEKAVPDKVQEVTDLILQMKKAEKQIESIKESLLKAMEEHGIKKFENEKVTFTYVAPSTKNTFDKTKLAKEHPEIDLTKYTKVSNVKASVRIAVK